MSTGDFYTTRNIKTLNNINISGLKIFDEDKYALNNESENPDAIIVRSENLHEMKFNQNLKAIARAGAGVNNIPVDKCTEKGIAVFNTPGANANAVKELTLAALIASSRNLFSGVEWIKTLRDNGVQVQKQVEVGKKQFVGREIKGKTLGVIGLGSIGVLVANDALLLGMDVIGFDPFISIDTAWSLARNVQRAVTLEELLTKSDYITIHVPLTDDTRGFLNKEKFSTMKHGVQILNFSRGELIDEQDMKSALDSGIVGNYITDFPNESVLKMKNTISIPHLGASTKESEENCAIMAARQVKDFLETGNVHNSVNFPNASLPYSGKRRVAVFHRNIPNMVGRLTAAISSYGLNIADMINRSRGEFAYTLIDIDEKVNGDIIPGLHKMISQIEGIITNRVI